MKHSQHSLQAFLMVILAGPGLLLSSPLMSQDHDDHTTHTMPQAQDSGATDHDHAAAASPHDDHGESVQSVMSHEMPVPPGPAEVRDPHAYSGGYTRTTGPYAFSESQQLSLADEMEFYGLWVDRFENREGDVEGFQEFAGHAWVGNSYRRFMLRSELEWRDLTIEESRTELLYSWAVSPFWNMQVGGRYDHGDIAHREWLAVGLSGISPYWFEVIATAYLNPEGHSAASIEVEYDLLLSQRLILQPKAGMDFYGDSDIEAGHSKGLSKSKMGLRLRYEISRQFAPYIGYERVHHHGEAATVFEPFGQHRETQWIAGFRFWF